MARRVNCWEEVRGRLHSWLPTEDGVIVEVSSRYFLPDFPQRLRRELTRYRGMTIGILKTDSGYALRAISTCEGKKSREGCRKSRSLKRR